ncbi:segregation and condensation protein A [Clostridium botulinum B str. Osaka05]|nr:segregation and condensation protein A [Clostridium botulinum B str. Osaka05]
MPLNIKIHNFDGPFDLLLHLIKKNKMEIYDVSIYEITNQYLQYLNRMEELDLEITSEFIVMAATLIEIKSKYLLPKVEEEKEEEENDPQKELLDKLLEYKKFKAAAEFF